MPHQPDTTSPEAWHRYFAMEANNRAWALAVKSRSAAEAEEMLNAAHAAAMHWGQIGTEIHHMRAKMLLAEVHALLGMGETAFALAETVLNYFTSIDTPDWELAFTHTIHAHAAYTAGKFDSYRTAYDKALAAISVIADEQDKEIVMDTFRQVPAP